MSEAERSRLAVLLDGAALADDEARALWTAFSAHMDEHQGDMAGFAKLYGYHEVRPEYRSGRAVLIVSTTAEAAAKAAAPPPKPKPVAKAKPAGNKPAGNKPAGNKPAGNKPGANKPAANKPAANNASGNKPTANKPAAKTVASKQAGAKTAPKNGSAGANGAQGKGPAKKR